MVTIDSMTTMMMTTTTSADTTMAGLLLVFIINGKKMPSKFLIIDEKAGKLSLTFRLDERRVVGR